MISTMAGRVNVEDNLSVLSRVCVFVGCPHRTL